MFKRRKQATTTGGPSMSPAELAEVGRAAYERKEVVDVMRFYVPMYEAAQFPPPGTAAWEELVDRFCGELLALADDDWSTAGAFHIAKDLIGADLDNPRYAELVDKGLASLHAQGVPGELIPMFGLSRWEEQHGHGWSRPDR